MKKIVSIFMIAFATLSCAAEIDTPALAKTFTVSTIQNADNLSVVVSEVQSIRFESGVEYVFVKKDVLIGQSMGISPVYTYKEDVCNKTQQITYKNVNVEDKGRPPKITEQLNKDLTTYKNPKYGLIYFSLC
jgi:hypothetical protein